MEDSLYFVVSEAVELGLKEAVFINNLRYWIMKNKANERHYHDGRTWSYCSNKALLQLMPFFSKMNIETIIKSLREKGVIMIGNYNQNSYDRTRWFAFVDEAKYLPSRINTDFLKSGNGFSQIKKWISPNQEMDLVKSGNGFSQIKTPIPNNKPNNKPNNIDPNNKPDNIPNSNDTGDTESASTVSVEAEPETDTEHSKTVSFVDAVKDESEEVKAVLREFYGARKQMGKPMTAIALKKAVATLNKLANTDAEKIEVVNQSILYGWQGLFAVKNKQPPQEPPKTEEKPKNLAECAEDVYRALGLI